MRLNKQMLFIDCVERATVIAGYISCIYFLIDITAPFTSKAFVFALITLILIIYVRQIFKKSKPAHEKAGIDVASNSLLSESRQDLSYSTLKYATAISFIGFIFLALVVSYEIFVQQSSRYFPLKLLAGILLYSIFKQCLRRLVSSSK